MLLKASGKLKQLSVYILAKETIKKYYRYSIN